MFAKEDLIRGRKLLHDGALQLKNSAGRLKGSVSPLLVDFKTREKQMSSHSTIVLCLKESGCEVCHCSEV